MDQDLFFLVTLEDNRVNLSTKILYFEMVAFYSCLRFYRSFQRQLAFFKFYSSCFPRCFFSFYPDIISFSSFEDNGSYNCFINLAAEIRCDLIEKLKEDEDDDLVSEEFSDSQNDEDDNRQ